MAAPRPVLRPLPDTWSTSPKPQRHPRLRLHAALRPSEHLEVHFVLLLPNAAHSVCGPRDSRRVVGGQPALVVRRYFVLRVDATYAPPPRTPLRRLPLCPVDRGRDLHRGALGISAESRPRGSAPALGPLELRQHALAPEHRVSPRRQSASLRR